MTRFIRGDLLRQVSLARQGGSTGLHETGVMRTHSTYPGNRLGQFF